MSVLVTDTGFTADDWAGDFTTPEALAANHSTPLALDLDADFMAEVLSGRLANISMIRVRFSNFADGRGFTIARQLRLAGFAGRLRACGPLIADQYAMARRAGFDEVEIDDDLAARQPEQQWLARADWQAHDYQSRLRG